MNKQEIVKKLIEIYGLRSQSELGEFLGVGRQGVHQWQNGKRQEDITTKIMTKLIERAECVCRHDM